MFSDAAAQLAGMAGALLGWGPDEFWGATPMELVAVLRALTGGVEPEVGPDALNRLMEMFPDG